MMRAIPLLLLAVSLPLLADDDTDFSTAPPATWQPVNSLGTAYYDFSGGVATLSCPAPSLAVAQVYGLARAALLGPTEFSQTTVSVDVISTGSTRAFASVIDRVGTPGLGTSTGYSLTIIPSENGKFQIHRLDGEVPTLISASAYAALIAGHTYRLVLTSVGDTHTGRIYDTADLTQSLDEISAIDATYSSGRSGIVVSTDSLVSITATFDNFLAWDGTPPSMGILPGDFSDAVKLTWEARRGLGCFVETTADFVSWSPTLYEGTSVIGGQFRGNYPTSGAQQFYRLRILGSIPPPAPALRPAARR